MALFDKYLGALFLTAFFQGVLLGVVLFFLPSKTKTANIFLGLLSFFFGLDIFYYVYIWSGWTNELLYLSAYGEGFCFLYGPLFFLYIRTLRTGILTKYDLFHSIPFLISVAYFIPYYIMPEAEKLNHLNLLISGKAEPYRYIIDKIFQAGKVISLASYLFFTLRDINKENFGLGKYASEQERESRKWIIKLAIFFAIFLASFLSYYVFLYLGLLKPLYDYVIALVMTFCIYFIIYNGFTKPQLFKGDNKVKYQNNLLSEQFIERGRQRLLSLIEVEKVHLNSNLRIGQLAETLGLSSYQLSQIINREFGQSFPEFINTFRINEAKKKLSDPTFSNDKMIKIALESGFNNKVSFYTAFRKATGQSPHEYRDKLFPKYNSKN